MADEFVWTPTPDYIERSHVAQFMRRHKIGDVAELVRRSTADVAWFWGAIAIPIFSGFAAPAVAARLNDGGARVLITADGTLRRGETVPLKRIADEAAAHSPTVAHVIVVRRLGRDVPWTDGRDHWWHEL